jgi:CRP/FNR family cyclic AMP-dependent transcriptional regulator
MHRNTKIELLKRVPLFARCSKRDLTEIAKLADEIDIKEGRELTREGQRGREFFVLVEGSAEVRRRGRKVNTMGSGDFFGEIALLSGRPRTATVKTTAPTRALVVTESSFNQLLRSSPEIQLKVLQAVVDRLPDEKL